MLKLSEDMIIEVLSYLDINDVIKLDLSFDCFKPFLGQNHYRTETDVHLSCILSGHWYTEENVRAETIGAERTMFFGPTSVATGRQGAIGVKLSRMGLNPSDTEMEKIIAKFLDLLKRRSPLPEAEVESIIWGVMGMP